MRIKSCGWLAGLAVGCGPAGKSGGGGTDSGGGDGGYDAWESVRDCAGDASDAALTEQIALVVAAEDSLHEMIACGQLYGTLIGELLNVLVVLVSEGPDSVALTEGYTWDGAGQYVAAPGGSGVTTMRVRFSFGADYLAGAAGELIAPNLFDPDSYLTGVSLDVDPSSLELLVRYDAPGPLVELLGRGESPRNPLRLGAEDLAGISEELLKQRVEMDILVDDPRDGGVVTYTVAASEATVESVFTSSRVDLAAVDLAAASAATGQQLTTLSWGVDYGSSFAALNGTVDFEVLGGDFDYLGTWEWVESPMPVRTLSCR